ncbi:coagulation factor III, tissue factor a isoform 1-T1 [Odontesthes bonariensis]|uniref:coagulation factor III, tissue factor a isoform X1 n=1 Tax=Odontesthes bonariensis TaxID=219752 RepID=UPI003F582C5E
MTLPVYLFIVLLAIHFASGFYPRAQNVTWKSTNFKTVLTWEPKPSANYSYTVEFSVVGRDKQRNHHCIRSSNTICDLSNSLTDLQGCYKADVLSEPPLGATSDLTEFPHTSSPQFCPYKETDIDRPDFELKMNEDKTITTVYVTDPLTALFKDDRQLNIRDIFSDQLQYKVTYRRNKSTGKKVHYSKSSVIELTDLDQGESYCFNIQAYIPSRSSDKQLGKMSVIKCSNNDDQSILKVYSFPVIAVAILLILLVIGIIISVTVVCCKHRKKLLKSGREGVPLQDV